MDKKKSWKKLLDGKVELWKSAVSEVPEGLDDDWNLKLPADLRPWEPEVRKVLEFPSLEEQVATVALEVPEVLVASSHSVLKVQSVVSLLQVPLEVPLEVVPEVVLKVKESGPEA